LLQRAPIPNDLAALVGKRLVTSSETNEGTRLNEARVKALSGGDSITARFLHAEFFTFQPVAKFFLAFNHRPRVQDDSFGFWRRVRLIPFNRVFSGSSDDKFLSDKLIAESSGILNWLIDGCLKWQKQGLDPTPECVQEATREYQTDSDPLSQFIDEDCAVQHQAQVKANDLYQKYLTWCEHQGYREKEKLTRQMFGRLMGQKFKKSHDRDGWHYHGIGSKCDGCVTDIEPKGNFCDVFGIMQPRMRINVENPSHPSQPSQTGDQENPSQPVTEENLTPAFSGSGQLPDCPSCGKNEWSFGSTGDLICVCGHIIPAENAG
jgi:phage/plasmid-associated DNA primase